MFMPPESWNLLDKALPTFNLSSLNHSVLTLSPYTICTGTYPYSSDVCKDKLRLRYKALLLFTIFTKRQQFYQVNVSMNYFLCSTSEKINVQRN